MLRAAFEWKLFENNCFFDRVSSCYLETAINQTLPGLECFLREVLGNEELSSEAEKKRQEFLKRLEVISTPPSLPPRPPQLPPRLYLRNDESGNRANDEAPNLPYSNDQTDDPVAFASRQRELSRNAYSRGYGYVGRRELFGEDSPIYVPQFPSNVNVSSEV